MNLESGQEVQENQPERDMLYLVEHPEEITTEDIEAKRFITNNFYSLVGRWKGLGKEQVDVTNRERWKIDESRGYSKKYLDQTRTDFELSVKNVVQELIESHEFDPDVLLELQRIVGERNHLLLKRLSGLTHKEQQRLNELGEDIRHRVGPEIEKTILPVYKKLRLLGYNHNELAG